MTSALISNGFSPGILPSSYGSKTINVKDTNGEAQVKAVFSYANKQSSTITDRPVLASKGPSQYVTISGWEGELVSFAVEVKQWTAKKYFKTVVLEYTVDGTNWVQASENLGKASGVVINTGNILSNVELPGFVSYFNPL